MSLLVFSVRGLLLRRRTLVLGLLPLLVGVVSVLVGVLASGDGVLTAYGRLSSDLFLSLVLALVALVLGVNALDDEREGGTLSLLMSISTSRVRIVGAKFVAAWVSTVLVSLPALAGLVFLGSRTGFGLLELLVYLGGALVLGAGAYVALFLLLSLVSRRGLLIGLGYVLVWEGLFANYTTAFKNMSVGAFSRRVVSEPWDGITPFQVADVSLLGAVVVLLVVLVVALGLAHRRLCRMSLTS